MGGCNGGRCEIACVCIECGGGERTDGREELIKMFVFDSSKKLFLLHSLEVVIVVFVVSENRVCMLLRFLRQD